MTELDLTSPTVGDLAGGHVPHVLVDEIAARVAADEISALSPLDRLRHAVNSSQAEVDRTVTIKIPGRDGMTLSCRSIPPARVQQLLDRHTRGKKVDQDLFTIDALAESTLTINLDGEPVVDDRGKPVTFRSAEAQQAFGGTEGHVDAIRYCFGHDMRIRHAWAQVVLHAADPEQLKQLSGEDEIEDPTNGS